MFITIRLSISICNLFTAIRFLTTIVVMSAYLCLLRSRRFNSKDHTTLVAAVKAAGLVETLQSAGPFTVFAPTNEAFNKLPAGTVDNLLKPENKAALTGILTYHVVAGAFKSTDLKDGQKVATVQGEELTIGYKDGKWTVTDAKGAVANITIADVISSNGVTYVIDAVLMPKK